MRTEIRALCYRRLCAKLFPCIFSLILPPLKEDAPAGVCFIYNNGLRNTTYLVRGLNWGIAILKGLRGGNCRDFSGDLVSSHVLNIKLNLPVLERELLWWIGWDKPYSPPPQPTSALLACSLSGNPALKSSPKALLFLLGALPQASGLHSEGALPWPEPVIELFLCARGAPSPLPKAP